VLGEVERAAPVILVDAGRLSGDFLVANEPGGIFERLEIRGPREDEFGAMVGEDRVGEGTVGGVELGFGLPDRYEEQAEPGAGAGDVGKPSGGSVRGFVEYQESGWELLVGAADSLVSLVDDVSQEPTEHGGEPVLFVQRRTEVEGVFAGEEPVEIDLLIVAGFGDAGVGPGAEQRLGGRVGT